MNIPSKSWKSFAALKAMWCVFNLGIDKHITFGLTFFIVWLSVKGRFAQANLPLVVRAVLEGGTLLLLENNFLPLLLLSFAFISVLTILRVAAIFLLFNTVVLFIILYLILVFAKEGISDRFKETFLSAASAFIFNFNGVLIL